MGQYLGSWAIDDYLTIPAVTHRFSTGAAYAPTGNVTIDIYEDDNTTQIASTPVNMTANFDSKTGFHIYKMQLTAANGFEQGKSYTALITATVDSVAAIDFHTFQIAADVTATATVAGTVTANVTQWNGENVATPSVAGVPEVDVTHWKGEGAAAVDTAGYPKVTIKDGTDQGELNLDTGRVDVNVTYWGGASAGTLAGASDVWNSASCPTRVLTAPTNITSDDGEIQNTASGVYVTSTAHTAGATVAAVTGAVGSVTGAVASVTGAVGSVTGNVGGNVAGNVTGSVGSIATGGIAAASIASDAITSAKIAADAIGTTEFSDALANKIADAILNRSLSATDTDSLNDRTVRSALRILRNKWAISAGTLKVCKENDDLDAPAWTSAVTQTAVNPVTASDPT